MPAPRLSRSLLAAALLLGLPGCRALLEGQDGRECSTSDDCLERQLCDVERGRCTAGPVDARPDVPSRDAGDAGPEEMGRPDAEPEAMVADVPVPDLRVRDLAVPDLAVPDLAPADGQPADVTAPDLGLAEVYGPEGDCFAGAQRGALLSSAGAAIPRVVCTSEALVWVATDAAGDTSLTARLGETERTVFTVPPAAPFLVHEGLVLAELPDAARDGRTAVFRFPLLSGPEAAPMPVLPGVAAQWHAARAQGVTGLVQGDAHRSDVVLVFDDGRTRRCGEPDRRQWGLTLGPSFSAWFEQGLAGGSVDVVIAEGHDCSPAVRGTVPPGVEATDRLMRDGTALYWMATDAASRRRLLHTLDAARPGEGSRPVNAQGLAQLSPVEFAVHDGWLLVSAFDARAYRLHLFDLTTGRKQALARPGSARAPSLSGRFALWAEQVGGSPWEIRYERLQLRR
jgi:hypothetical protein